MAQTRETLDRLICTGKCNCLDAQVYAEQLVNLANTEADKGKTRRRGKFFKALGDESRQRILSLLLVREFCVCELMTAFNMTQPTTSHHLKILEDVGIVENRRDGKWVFYNIPDKSRVSLLLGLSD